MKKLLLPLLLICSSLSVMAQQEAPLTRPKITIHVGFLHRGAGQSLEKQMEQSGFGEESTSSGFFGPEENPERAEGSIQLGITFPVKQKYTVKGLLNYRETDLSGYAFYYDYLEANTSALTIAAIGYAPIPSQLIRVGLGPAFHLVEGAVIHNDAELGSKDFSKAGFVAEVGFSYPANKRLYADLQVQYLYAGKGNLGTYMLSGTDFSDQPTTKEVEFNETSFNSFVLSIGIGYRFRN